MTTANAYLTPMEREIVSMFETATEPLRAEDLITYSRGGYYQRYQAGRKHVFNLRRKGWNIVCHRGRGYAFAGRFEETLPSTIVVVPAQPMFSILDTWYERIWIAGAKRVAA